jgi:hypothetical protein
VYRVCLYADYTQILHTTLDCLRPIIIIMFLIQNCIVSNTFWPQTARLQIRLQTWGAYAHRSYICNISFCVSASWPLSCLNPLRLHFFVLCIDILSFILSLGLFSDSGTHDHMKCYKSQGGAKFKSLSCLLPRSLCILSFLLGLCAVVLGFSTFICLCRCFALIWQRILYICV